MNERHIRISIRENGTLSVGVYFPDGSRISGAVFQEWPAVLTFLGRAEREGYEVRAFVRPIFAVNTADGFGF